MTIPTAAEPARSALLIPRCECGAATGLPCAATIDAGAATIEWMPEHLRSSHAAAGARGSWPGNGALRLRVAAECADALEVPANQGWLRMLGSDGEWFEVDCVGESSLGAEEA